MPFFNYIWNHIRHGIKRKDIVIDIGSGNSPFLRSDILVEKYLEDDSERYSGIVLDRQTVCADGISLPFRDKSVDFIYCSHVLEHIPEPGLLLDELNRVGKRGLIVTPHPGYDMIHPRRGHLWYIWNLDGTLRLVQKQRWNEYPDIYAYFRKITYLPGYWQFWDKNYAEFNTMLEWEGRISYRIERYGSFDMSKFVKAVDRPAARTATADKRTQFKSRVKSLTARMIRPLISANTRFDFNGIICCPLCKGTLSACTPRSVSVACTTCSTEFPVRGGIPRLIRMKKEPIPQS